MSPPYTPETRDALSGRVAALLAFAEQAGAVPLLLLAGTTDGRTLLLPVCGSMSPGDCVELIASVAAGIEESGHRIAGAVLEPIAPARDKKGVH